MNQKYFKNTWKMNQMYFGIQVLERIVLSQKKSAGVRWDTLGCQSWGSKEWVEQLKSFQ